MKERPILFSSPMVRSILNGSKTQTRRVISRPLFTDGKIDMPCRYGSAGDVLWVKETFRLWDYDIEGVDVDFQATTPEGGKYVAMNPKPAGLHKRRKDGVLQWKPSLFMPRWASRIMLELTAVRVERLHDISEEDAMAEGCKNNRVICPVCGFVIRRAGNPGAMCPEYSCEGDLRRETFKEAFAELWDSIQLQRSKPKGAFAWSQNPWVYVISFKRIYPK